MAKIKFVVSATIEETFSDFIISRKTKGLAEKTLQSDQSQFQAVARHMDVRLTLPPCCLRQYIETIRETVSFSRSCLVFVSGEVCWLITAWPAFREGDFSAPCMSQG